MKKYLIIIVTIIAILTFTGCRSTGNSITRTIEVSGSASVTVEPDIASFSVRVSEKGETTSEAQHRANQKMHALLSTLRAANVEERDLKTTMVSLWPNYEYIDNRQVITGQVASQSVHVTVRNLSALGSIIDSLGEVSGITLNSISFDKEDKSEAEREAREKALAKALSKAGQYAGQVDMRATLPITISEYSVASNPYNPGMKAMAYESYDMATEISPGTLTITSSVSLVMEME
ncbi:MAG TPA: SIMPL domain-containing protein [Sphaerochaeta sp.]|nr:SIMPL domain-containing protein [Sphaerochaeta sp.]